MLQGQAGKLTASSFPPGHLEEEKQKYEKETKICKVTAVQAYVAARESGKDEAGDVLLVLTDRLAQANYKDTFVDQFAVRHSICQHGDIQKYTLCGPLISIHARQSSCKSSMS